MDEKCAEALRRYAAMFNISSGLFASVGGGDAELAVKAVAGAMSPALSLTNMKFVSGARHERFAIFNASLRDIVIDSIDVCDGSAIEFVLCREVNSYISLCECAVSLGIVIGGVMRGKVFVVVSGTSDYEVNVHVDNLVRLAGRILEFVSSCGLDYDFVKLLCDRIYAATIKAINIVKGGVHSVVVRKTGTLEATPLDDICDVVGIEPKRGEPDSYVRVTTLLYDIARRASSVVCGTVLDFADVCDNNVEVLYSGEAVPICADGSAPDAFVHCYVEITSASSAVVSVSLSSQSSRFDGEVLRLVVNSDGKLSHMGSMDVVESCARLAVGVVEFASASDVYSVDDVIAAIDYAVMAAVGRFVECPDISISLFEEVGYVA